MDALSPLKIQGVGSREKGYAVIISQEGNRLTGSLLDCRGCVETTKRLAQALNIGIRPLHYGGNTMFYGWQKISLIEYPGHIATVLFTGGCNFRCPYCQNPPFIPSPPQLPSIPVEAILPFLDARRQLVDAVVVTGGEPLLHAANLERFLETVKEMGYLVKVDTNASLPAAFSRLNRSGFIDLWGIDYKVPFSQYAELTTQDAGESIRQTLGDVLQTPDRVELRTTLYPPALNLETLLEMSGAIVRATRWYWQNFRNKTTLSPVARTVAPYPVETLLSWKQEVDRTIGKEIVVLR